MGIRTSARCDFDHSIGALSFRPITHLRYSDKRIGNIMDVHSPYLKEQLATRINTIQ